MRGTIMRQVTFLTLTPDQLIPPDHPIRRVKPLVDTALAKLSPVFDAMYAESGRPSIPPEHLLKACLLMAFYSIRSERQFCERLQYDLLFKWFLDLNVEDPAFDQSSFAKNRERLLEHDVSRQFFEAVLQLARQQHLLSSQHFTVDGTLLESWASLKSFKPRGPNRGGQRKPMRVAGASRQRQAAAIPKSTFMGRSGAISPTFRAPITRPGWPKRGRAARPGSALPGTC